MRTANAITHDVSSSISGLGAGIRFVGILGPDDSSPAPRTAAVIEIVGTPTEENRRCGLR
jgi:hypothetical protein